MELHNNNKHSLPLQQNLELYWRIIEIHYSESLWKDSTELNCRPQAGCLYTGWRAGHLLNRLSN